MHLNCSTLPIAHTLRFLRSVLPIRGWNRIFEAAFPAGSQLPFQFHLTVPGGTILADATSYLDRFALFHGSIEPDELHLVRQILCSINARTVLDVGANVGHFSIAMAEHCKTVHAFEPNPPVYAKLLENIRINPDRHIIPHQFGLSDADKVLRFVSVSAAHDGQGNFAETGDIALPVSRGDTLNIDQIDFIKIDVEGHELSTLRGPKETLISQRPIIMCECSSDAKALSGVLPPNYCLFVLGQRAVRARKKLYQVDNFAGSDNVFFVPNERSQVLAEKL
ncbi:FkbM family methyltransferase [Rhodoplanes sp. Z2-YC6860]|uniref:FkbM family methyltransferase n=1 Tax=Rhodoplanes sp. Z2-YC6860 TaxID=674703 RepID=UPI00078C3390|nr:FkbM family methyltransferase [Rhodoplanes sp. Z2-YC6860]AMN43761.1 FkbM family methyltransferase [Rhodoplanes sp. Z2-YC6860]